ncbi:MAG TPA: hypothetical protein VEK38_01655 [Candidatus Bathyarchaeia archaeon]|nr:hypothetical protein [Candidatus Bathyarchaeia archaeon]
MKLYIKNGLYVCGLICATNISAAESRSITQKEAVLLQQAIKERIKGYEGIVEDKDNFYNYKQGLETVKKITQEELFKAGFFSEGMHILDMISDSKNYVGGKDEQNSFWNEKMMVWYKKCEEDNPDKKEFYGECRLIYKTIQEKVTERIPMRGVLVSSLQSKKRRDGGMECVYDPLYATNISSDVIRSMTQEKVELLQRKIREKLTQHTKLLERALNEKIKEYKEIVNDYANMKDKDKKCSYDYKQGLNIVNGITPEKLFSTGFFSEGTHILDMISDLKNYDGKKNEQRDFWHKQITVLHEICEKNDPDRKELYRICGWIYKTMQEKVAEKFS